MRLELKFLLKDNSVALDDRAIVMSFFKRALEEKYPVVYKNLYDGNELKTFTFSIYLPGAQISGDRYILSHNFMRVKISSPDVTFLSVLYNALCAARTHEYKLPFDNAMRIEHIGYSESKHVTSDRAVIKFLSPMLVRRHDRESNKDTYLDYTSVGFADALQSVCNGYLECRGIEKAEVSLVPLNARRTVTACLKLKFNSSFGVFELRTRPDIIEELYLAGIGSRRSEGFGLFDIISQGDAEE
jgi:CRISPR-associated endoribonuclease Cas6